MVSVNVDTAASGTLSSSLSSTQNEALGRRPASLHFVELRFPVAHSFALLINSSFAFSCQFFLCL